MTVLKIFLFIYRQILLAKTLGLKTRVFKAGEGKEYFILLADEVRNVKENDVYKREYITIGIGGNV